jgi:hypothetical protein
VQNQENFWYGSAALKNPAAECLDSSLNSKENSRNHSPLAGGLQEPGLGKSGVVVNCSVFSFTNTVGYGIKFGIISIYFHCQFLGFPTIFDAGTHKILYLL